MTGPMLVVDVGGTKTSIGIARPSTVGVDITNVATYSNAEESALGNVIDRYLQDREMVPAHAVIAVAGRVDDGKASITNLPWHVDATELQRSLDLDHIRLLNDVEALALSVPHLRAEEAEQLKGGKRAEHGTIAVIAPGTGLGEAFLTQGESRSRAYATEGGHASFAPNGNLEARLLAFLAERFGHVSVERVCSGAGLQNLYQFLVASEGALADEEIGRGLDQGTDATPQIVAHALQSTQPTCVRAVELLVSILGAEAGNLALKVLANGGIYLGGGMPARIAPFLRTAAFEDAFISKGRFAHWLRQVPVWMITHPHAVLAGAAAFGITLRTTEGK